MCNDTAKGEDRGETEAVRGTAPSRRAKEGASGFLPGACLPVTLALLKTQVKQLDRLAIEIRAARGNWITRSGIVTAIIEAAFRSDVEQGSSYEPDRQETGLAG